MGPSATLPTVVSRGSVASLEISIVTHVCCCLRWLGHRSCGLWTPGRLGAGEEAILLAVGKNL